AVTTAEAKGAQVLRKAADESNRPRGAEGRPVVLVDAVAQAPFADLVDAQEPVQADGAAIGHQNPVEGNRQPDITEALNGVRDHKQAATRGNNEGVSVLRIRGVGGEAVEGRGGAAVEPVGEPGVY